MELNYLGSKPLCLGLLLCKMGTRIAVFTSQDLGTVEGSGEREAREVKVRTRVRRVEMRDEEEPGG